MQVILFYQLWQRTEKKSIIQNQNATEEDVKSVVSCLWIRFSVLSQYPKWDFSWIVCFNILSVNCIVDLHCFDDYYSKAL